MLTGAPCIAVPKLTIVGCANALLEVEVVTELTSEVVDTSELVDDAAMMVT